MTLLQIAGGQTWPNFLPLLGFRPGRVIFLTSHDPHGLFAASIQSMEAAAKLAGVSVCFHIVSTTTSQPTLQECSAALGSLDGESIDLINLTGGTKAMSTAGYRYAMDRGIPSFHLDTRRTASPFDDFGTAPLSLPFPNLAETTEKIDVRIALKAQGFPVPSSFKKPTTAHLAFATRAAEIRSDPAADKEIATQIFALRKQFTEETGKFLGKGKLRAALQCSITPAPGSPWHRYLEAAATHGIAEEISPAPEFILATPDPLTTPSAELRSSAETHFKLLEGIWFELAVFDVLRLKSSFRDVCWSVEADASTDAAASSKGETDLVAFNQATLNLHFISCKTSGPHGTPLDHIQGLRRRATKEGGEFSKAELWIFRPKDEQHRLNLANHCNTQGVSLRIFTGEC